MVNGIAQAEESGHYYTFTSLCPPGEYFDIRPRNLPHNVKPIVDDESGLCIGYSLLQAPGLWRIYDADGLLIRFEEAPLKTPLIDPTDLALLAFGAFRIFQLGRGLLQTQARTVAAIKLNQTTVNLLRGRLKIGLNARRLKMTETAAKHMREPGRYVPLQIQEKAIRYGRRMPDPQNQPGLFRYEASMYRLVENKSRKGDFFHKKFMLEVVVREKDWTITHFLYK